METQKQKRMAQLKEALTKVKSLDASQIKCYGSNKQGEGMNIWPNGLIQKGHTIYANSVYVSSLNCNTKGDCISAIKKEIEYIKSTSE